MDEAFWSFEQRHLVVSETHSNPLTILLIPNKSKKNAKEPPPLVQSKRDCAHGLVRDCGLTHLRLSSGRRLTFDNET